MEGSENEKEEAAVSATETEQQVFGRVVAAGIGAPLWLAIVLMAAALCAAGTWLYRGEMFWVDVAGGVLLAVLIVVFAVGKVTVDAKGVRESGLFRGRRILWSKTDYACPASDLSVFDLNFYDQGGKIAGRIDFAQYSTPEKIVEEISRRTRLVGEPAAIAPVTRGRWREGAEVSAPRMFSLMWEIIHTEPEQRGGAMEKVHRLIKEGRIGPRAEHEKVLAILQAIEKDGVSDARRRELEEWYWRCYSPLLRSHLAGYPKGGVIGVTLMGAVFLVKAIVSPGSKHGSLLEVLWVLGATCVFNVVVAAGAWAYVHLRFQREMTYLKEYKSQSTKTT
jgi:hypothetical protein